MDCLKEEKSKLLMLMLLIWMFVWDEGERKS